MSFNDLYDPDFKPRGAGESETQNYWKPIEQDQRANEIQWLSTHIDILEQNRETIVEDPALYGVLLESAGVDTTLTVPYNLNLGPLLEIWDKGDFLRECPDCGEQAYVVYGCGSPLSGTHSWGGFCRAEESPVSVSRYAGLGELLDPVRSYKDQRKAGDLVDSDLELFEVIERLFDEE